MTPAPLPLRDRPRRPTEATGHDSPSAAHGTTTHGFRRPSRPSRRPPFLAGTTLILASFVGAACFGGVEGGGTGIGEPEEWAVSLTVTNVGDGTGGIVAEFSAGTVDNPCPDFLEPGESCTIEAEHTSVISGVAIDTEPGPFSRFVEFGGVCSGSDAGCDIQVPQEGTVSLIVEVDFQLLVNHIAFAPDPLAVAVGGDATVDAEAFADPAGTLPVESADVSWESSDPATASVAGAGTSATVSGVQAGAAWVRATARGTTDSVRVAVGG